MLHLNSVFPQQLASVCHSANVPLIHVSTNCVFSGDRANYRESDVPDASDIYGQSKARGEPSTCVVLRCSIIGFETALLYKVAHPEIKTEYGPLDNCKYDLPSMCKSFSLFNCLILGMRDGFYDAVHRL